jgi:hypothetical protein
MADLLALLRQGEKPCAGPWLMGYDQVAGITLFTVPPYEDRSCTGDELFNAFVALKLSMAGSSQRTGCVHCVSLPEGGCVYPSTRTRQKILKFLHQYDASFLPVQDDHTNFFCRFIWEYYTFTFMVNTLIAWQNGGSQQRPSEETADAAMCTLNMGLRQVQPRLQLLAPNVLAPTFEAGHGLYRCYATFLDALQKGQRAFRYCELPSCQMPFIVVRDDQRCCTPRHANSLRQLRHSKPQR